MDLPPDDDLTPDKLDAMVKRHARQLGEHVLAVAVIAIRTEEAGASGVYFRTAGNHHAAEKAAEDFVNRARIRREVRYRREAEDELDSQSFGDDPPPLPGDEWKGGA
jgi:hypothetical protein